MKSIIPVLGLATLLFIGSVNSQYDSRGDEDETDGEDGRSEFQGGMSGGMGDDDEFGGSDERLNNMVGHRHEGMGGSMGDTEGFGGSHGRFSNMVGHRHEGMGGMGRSKGDTEEFGGSHGRFSNMVGHRHEGMGGMGRSKGDTEEFGGSHGRFSNMVGHRHEGMGGMGRSKGDTEEFGGSHGRFSNMVGHRHEGMGGMGGSMGGRGGGRGGSGGRRRGRGGVKGGRGGGRGGRSGVKGGRGWRRGRGGKGGGRGGKGGRRGDRKQQRQDAIKQKQEQNEIANMVKGMTNFTTGNYQHDSKMMAVYLRASDKVISLLEKRQEILMNKLKIANVNGKIRMQVTKGVYKRTKRVTDRWNSKCQDKFIEWVNKVGENPTEKDLEKAKAKIDMIAANYVDAVKKLFDHLSATLDKNDQGYYLDAVKQENGNPKKMMALMRDIKKISANLGSAIQEKKADMEPHHDKKHMPSAAEVHLMKRLGSVRVHALDAFSEFQKGILAKCSPKDRSKPVDIAILKHSLKLLEVKKDELLKKAVLEMEDIIEQDKVAPELVPLKEKLSTIAQDIFNQEKTSRMPELTAIMVDLTHRVGKKPGAKIIERMLRKKSIKEMALMQIAIGDAVLKAVDRLGHSGGSLEEQVEKGSSSLKSTITEVMDKTRDSLKEFVERKVNDLETGQGIFGHIKKLDKRTKN